MLKALLALHVAGGSVALLTMVVPMVTRKGGRAHRRAGWAFVAGMTVVSLTALVLAGHHALFDTTPGQRLAGAFLFYIAILTGAGVSAGVRVLRFKGRTAPHRHAWDLGVAGLLTASSVALAAFGLAKEHALFIAFSTIGLLTGGGQLVYWLRRPAHRMHWWFEHMGAMLGSCVAATTAFLVVNAERWGLGTFSLAAWLAPTIIGAPGIAVWTAYYRRRFTRSAGSVPDTSRSSEPNTTPDGRRWAGGVG